MVKHRCNKKYQDVVEKLNDSKFEELPDKRILTVGNITQAHKNLWSMFHLKFTAEEMEKLKAQNKEPFGMNISHYAWTTEVKEAFYNHEYHKRLFKKIRRLNDMTYGMWVLNSEPADIEIETEFEKEVGFEKN